MCLSFSSLVTLILSLSLVALLPSFTAAQTSCGALGYDLSSLTTTDLLYSDSTGSYAIRPCGSVTTAGYCSGEFCIGAANISVYQSSGSYSIQQLGWAALPNGAGIVQQIQDGSDAPGSCGWEGQWYSGTIEFMCNASATTAVLSNVTQLAPYSCHYQAIIQTSAACPTATTDSVASQPGAAVLSSTCGGGFYPLSGVGFDTGYISYFANNSATGGTSYEYLASICEAIPNAPGNCAWQSGGGYSTNFTSVCQYTPGYYGSALAVWEPSVFVPVWTYLGPGAISYTLADGTGCLDEFNRFTNITILCNSSATTPTITSVAEHTTCHYWITVQSSAVCGTVTAFPGLPVGAPGGGGSSSAGAAVSSSSAVIAASGSSSSAAGPASTNTTASSSTGSVVAASSSAVVSSSAATVVTSSTAAPTSAAVTPSSTAAATSAMVTPASTATPTSAAVIPSSTAAPVSTPSSTAAPTATTPASTAAASSSTVIVPASSSSGTVTTPPIVNGASAAFIAPISVSLLTVGTLVAALLL